MLFEKSGQNYIAEILVDSTVIIEICYSKKSGQNYIAEILVDSTVIIEIRYSKKVVKIISRKYW
jgi:hypothetical protein